VRIEKKHEGGGKVLIDFFNVDDLVHIRSIFAQQRAADVRPEPQAAPGATSPAEAETPSEVAAEKPIEQGSDSKAELATGQDDLYSISNFSV
jgi:hypothetical protein